MKIVAKELCNGRTNWIQMMFLASMTDSVAFHLGTTIEKYWETGRPLSDGEQNGDQLVFGSEAGLKINRQ